MAIVAIAIACSVFFIAPILGVLLGAFSGWIVSILAPVWVPTGMAFIGIKIVASDLVALGAALGFLGGFIRSSCSSSK